MHDQEVRQSKQLFDAMKIASYLAISLPVYWSAFDIFAVQCDREKFFVRKAIQELGVCHLQYIVRTNAATGSQWLLSPMQPCFGHRYSLIDSL